ncbi:MAG TPA: hypothetical protein VFV87_20655 [Pirellulaceae bacterium]|nr:hypothetical protein [Pirellulaceae bacterium]
MSTNRTAAIAKVYKVLKKHYKPIAPQADRGVLEHLLYACLLENARFDAADEAFAKLKELYFDWNEIRVTTVTELAEGMPEIPDATEAAQRVKKSLQSIFEGSYSFDMEAMKKQNLGKAEKDLEKINGSTPFVRAYVAQNGLSGHNIPVSRSSLEVLYGVGVINDAEADKGQVPGLERAIPKNKGVEFGSLLHQLGADYQASPGSSKLKGILAEIDPEYKDRMSARQSRLEAEAAAQAEAAKEARQKARAEARAAAAEAKLAPKSAGKDSPKVAPKPAPQQEGNAKEKSAAAPKTAKAAASKGLAKKKPR